MKATIITLFIVGFIAILGGAATCGKSSEHRYDDGYFMFPIAMLAIGFVCEILSILLFIVMVMSRT